MRSTRPTAALLIHRVAQCLYVRSLVDAYHALPDTACCARPDDRRFAAELFNRHVPLQTARDALLLATARRCIRTLNEEPPPPVRSLRYYRGTVDELLATPINPDYRRYLERVVDTTRAATRHGDPVQRSLPLVD